MRQVKYTGKAGTLGRFGHVKSGAVLTLTEAEAFYVRGNPHFVVSRESQQRDGEAVYPAKGGYYDLTTLAWGDPRVFREVAALRRTRLVAVLKQMEALGLSVPAVDVHGGADLLRDAVLTTARHAGWLP